MDAQLAYRENLLYVEKHLHIFLDIAKIKVYVFIKE